MSSRPALRSAGGVVLLLAAAAAWGVLGHAGDRLVGGVWLTSLGVPWLVLAFAAGALVTGRPRVGALAGAALLVAGVAAYYVVLVYGNGPQALPYAGRVGAAWALVAAPAGALFGWAGAVWRAARPDGIGRLAAALPAAALLGEAVLLAGEWEGRAATAALALEAGAAALVLAVTARRGAVLITIAAAVAMAVVFALGEAEVRAALRGVGWAGA